MALLSYAIQTGFRRKTSSIWLIAELIISLFMVMPVASSAATNEEKLIVIGSSTAAGIGASRAERSWVGMLTPWLATNRHWTVENLSVPGILTEAAICTARRSIAQKAIQKGAKYLILSFPSNDATAGIPPEVTIQNVKSIVACAAQKKIKVAVVSTLPRFGLSTAQRNAMNQVDQAIKNELGKCFIDVSKLLLSANGLEPNAYYAFGDGVHFNDRGHLVIFNAITNFLDKQECI